MAKATWANTITLTHFIDKFVNTTVNQIYDSTGVESNLKPGFPSWLLKSEAVAFCTLYMKEQVKVRKEKENQYFKKGTKSCLTYIWNNGILSGGKESAVSKNLQADKYKMSSLGGISPIEGPFPSVTETFILFILLLFL
jgi:hypothetical protein